MNSWSLCHARPAAFGLAALVGLALAGFCGAATADAQSTTNAVAQAAGSSPAKPAPAPGGIPRSVFTMPANPEAGKDPFFPRSLRPYGTMLTAKTNQPSTNLATDLHLQGFSGPLDRRLAIINNRTFETGEEGEIVTSNGRTRLRCLEIKGNSVTIFAGGEQRTLYFRRGL
jgi:hypothetical protein